MKYLIVACLLLVGCVKQPTSVIIPVHYSTAPLKEMPPLALKQLNPNNSAPDVVRAYVKSVIVQREYIKYLRTVLSAYQ